MFIEFVLTAVGGCLFATGLVSMTKTFLMGCRRFWHQEVADPCMHECCETCNPVEVPLPVARVYRLSGTCRKNKGSAT